MLLYIVSKALAIIMYTAISNETVRILAAAVLTVRAFHTYIYTLMYANLRTILFIIHGRDWSDYWVPTLPYTVEGNLNSPRRYFARYSCTLGLEMYEQNQSVAKR